MKGSAIRRRDTIVQTVQTDFISNPPSPRPVATTICKLIPPFTGLSRCHPLQLVLHVSPPP